MVQSIAVVTSQRPSGLNVLGGNQDEGQEKTASQTGSEPTRTNQ